MKERTFLIIKPDGVQRKLVGTVIKKLENKGLKLVAIKMLKVGDKKAQQLYQLHETKPFYQKLITFIQSSPIVATVWEGNNAVLIVRKIIGDTDPLKSVPGTLRGDFSINITYNIIHASDSLINAKNEIDIFFSSDEIIDYKLSNRTWIKEQE